MSSPEAITPAGTDPAQSALAELLLVGAGGHAKAIVEAIEAAGGSLRGYVDPCAAAWLDRPRYAADGDAPATGGAAIGVGGIDPDALARRLALLERYAARGFALPPVVHPAATVSRTAALGAGVVVLAGAVVQPDGVIGDGAIVNSRALVEHDCRIGRGAHVAPGAIVLGGCTVGECAMVGAGSVVLPGSEVPERATVRAGERYPR